MNTPATPSTAAHDFDFLVGHWTTRQRRLKHRLQGSDDWESFDATTTNQHLPGGVINFDTLVAPHWRPGWVGMSVRVFNPATNLWSIYWVTNEGGGIDPATGHLDAPVVGRFHGDEGVFEGEDVFEGRAIRVRFHWQRLGADRARWQQAFSDDGGQSWEVNWVMAFERVAAPCPDDVPALDIDCQVVELRQYTLHPGQRDTLIGLFDSEFVEPQEAEAMAVMGQFRDLDAPERFVWLRGFADMASRARGLAAFYGGPVWQEHRDAANATMIDSDDVLLLRPAWPGSGIPMQGRHRAPATEGPTPRGVLSARVLPLREPASAELLRHCRETLTPCLHGGGADVLGWYVTEHAPNNFPRLPVREGAPVLVVFAVFADPAALEAFERSGAWSRAWQGEPSDWLAGAPQCLRLQPTTRSAIHA
ncbi:MAG TPA: NIPSNAP family protein [Hydrogenophaga sp.]|uniref:NIPSNAP family protein n=1 Tax=Hydrogenophaga sp. TaxID=1904254 RepID=UPI002C6F1301|nr:NIPSNAP family protein [Hydrogenophaga sp.]HSX92258.1 NIPSNAP family protein [Hydrogenophaga sp.]